MGLFKTYSEKEVKRVMPIVKKINGLEEEISKLSDEELRAKTDEFKKELENGKTLNDILENIGDVNCTLAKEITKIHENFIRGSISEIIAKFEEIKGEYVIILDLNNNVKEKNNFEEMSLEEHYLYYEKKGMDKKEIIKQIAKDKNTNKNEIYQKFLKK